MHHYTVSTSENKLVADYANMSIPETMNLNVIEFYELYRDAFLYNNMSSDEGNKRLEDAWILEQSKPDRSALKSLMEEVNNSGR